MSGGLLSGALCVVDSAGKLLYLAGIVLAEALRLPRPIARVRSRGAWHGADAASRVLEAIVMAAVLLGIWLFPVAYASTNWLRPFDYTLPAWAFWPASAAFLASLAVRWQSHRALGQQWSFTLETAEGHRLVTGGIYARLRHPLYTSLILWAAAQPVLLQNLVAGWGGPVAVALIWLVRVPREERMMLEAFAAEYRQYAERAGRIFPRCRPRQRAS